MKLSPAITGSAANLQAGQFKQASKWSVLIYEVSVMRVYKVLRTLIKLVVLIMVTHAGYYSVDERL